MFRKLTNSLLGTAVGILLVSPLGHAEPQATTSTTTVESVTQTQGPAQKSSKRAAKRSSSPAAPAMDTMTVQSTTTTTEVVPPPKEVVHKVYDEEMLEKMSKDLCSQGFKAYVGGHRKNVCKSKATAPDLAYTCVWEKEGPPAFSATEQGPCNLDYTKHEGSVIIKKENFASNPPLGYGTDAQCCFRPAKGLETSSLSQ